jgi:hypothetical protein
MNKLVNRRVEVTGTLDTKDGAGASGVGTVSNAGTGAQTGSGTTRTGAPDTASSRTGSDSTRMAAIASTVPPRHRPARCPAFASHPSAKFLAARTVQPDVSL